VISSCPATFDLARRDKVTQVYFKVKMSKKLHRGLLANVRTNSRMTIAVVTLRLLPLKKPQTSMKMAVKTA
jgi:hypothetical protein